MNRPLLITILALPIVATIAIFIVQYALSFHTLKIELTDGIEATVLVKKGQNTEEVRKITESAELRVVNGEYSIVPSGEKIETVATLIEIKDTDASVRIDPPYSEAYLDQVLAKERVAINKTLNREFPQLNSGYFINDGALIQKGEWFITTATKSVEYSDMSSDVYRIILQKNGTQWESAVTPALTLSYSQNKDVPYSVIDAANKLNGDSGRAFEKFRVRENNANRFFEDL